MNEIYDVDYINTNGNYIHETAIIGENVKLGKGNIIMPYAVIGQIGFIRGVKKHKGIIEIGNDNKIGCHVCIMSPDKGKTIIWNNNLIMNLVNIAHNVWIKNNCEIGAGTIISGHVLIEHDANIKVGVVIRNRKTIGEYATIGMGAVVVKDVEPHESVIGNPARCI